MPRETGHMMSEDDIGSGEKGPAEQETQRQIEQIPPHEAQPRNQEKGRAPQGKPPPSTPS